jgi:subtilase family serine protease
VSTAQSAAQQDLSELRAEPPTWIFDHRSQKGFRVKDKIRAAEKTNLANRTDVSEEAGQLSTSGPAGYSPAQIRRAYKFDELDKDGKGQIIGIPNAFHYPNAAADLKKFITTFQLKTMYGLPGKKPCTVAAGPHPCFQVVYARGVQPAFDELWALETVLDIQWAHAIAQGADILLVEASSNSFVDLFQAVNVTTNLGATVVSMSWGGLEFPEQVIFEPLFDLNGVTFIAAAGDNGNPGSYPAASPFVIAAGGTSLFLDRKGNRTAPEKAWSGSGGGISQYFPEPEYQYTYPIPDTFGYRGIPDVAYNADPATGFSVYDSSPIFAAAPWLVIAGTSAAAPQWAGLIALANQLRHGDNLSSNNVINSPIYEAARRDYRDNFFDIKSGSNGACGSVCTAVRGYDFVTGLGSPRAGELVPALAKKRHH